MFHLIFLVLLNTSLWTAQVDMIKVRKGEVFKIVLKANHSTGYSWYWEDKPDTSILDSVFVNYVLEMKTVTGGGGNEIWEIRAREKGEQTMTMVYKRPWETGGAIEKKEFIVKVE